MTSTDDTTNSPPARPLGSAMADAGRLVRPIALLALLSMLLAQAVAPAIKGVAMGLGRMIDGIDIAAGIGSHLLAIAASALSIGLILLIARDRKINMVVRILLIAQTTVILILGVPASRFRLSAFACFFIGLVACSLAIVGSVEAMRQPRSRAAGLVLSLTAIAALLRMVPAALLALSSPARAERFASFGAAAATLSALMFGASLFIGLAWIASRSKKVVSAGSLFALSATMFLTWGAGRATRPAAPGWSVFLSRALEQLVPDPASRLPALAEMFLAGLAPMTAIAVLASRRQIPAVAGAIALTITAGTTPDVPGRALILALASLSVVLAARDDRGMWAALIGRTVSDPPKAG